MPRTLSGLKTGEFDTIDVSESINTHNLQTTGQFSHTGSTPAEFDTMTVGPDGGSGVKLTVNGNIACSQMTTTGLEAELTFQHTGDTATAAHTYNGGTARSIDFGKLTLTKGGATVGQYLPLSASDTTLNIPETSIPALEALTVKHRDGTANVSYDGTVARTIHIPRLQVASLTSGSTVAFNIPETAAVISSGFGITLAPAASTSYLIEVQCWCENNTTNSETITLVLSQSKTGASPVHASHLVFEGKAAHNLVVFRKVLTLAAGTHQVGLAFHTEDDGDGDNCHVYYGGEYPDVVMTAHPLG
jgi:hypothetical protein